MIERPRGSHAAVPPGRRQRVARWLRRRNIARFELFCVAAFHLLVGITILTAPRSQVITPGTSVIFGTVPPLAWAAWFLLTGCFAAAAVHRLTQLRLWATWCGVFPLGGAWIYGFSLAVTSGRGNAVFALVWPFLLAWWAALAIRMILGGTEARWDGG